MLNSWTNALISLGIFTIEAFIVYVIGFAVGVKVTTKKAEKIFNKMMRKGQ